MCKEHWLFIYSINTTGLTCRMTCQKAWDVEQLFQNFTMKLKIKRHARKRQYLIKWILQGKYVEIREISLRVMTGQQSWLLNDGLDINKRRRKSRWKERRVNTSHLLSSKPFVALYCILIVLKQKKCAFFRVFTIISSVTTPSSRKKKWRPRKIGEEHAWDDTGDREMEFQLPNLYLLASAASRRKKALFRNTWFDNRVTGAWITKANSLNISLADVKGF